MTRENRNRMKMIDTFTKDPVNYKYLNKVIKWQSIPKLKNFLILADNRAIDRKTLINEIKYEKREIVKTIILNSKNVIVKIVDVCFGGTNSAVLKPKDVLQEAIKLGAPKIILVHNHPSGDPTPSKNDMEFTERLIKASQIVGVELLDHVVIGDCDYKSIFYILRNNIS